METDPRRVVKQLAFKDLKLLAVKGSHMWTTQDVEVSRQILDNFYTYPGNRVR